MRPMQRITTGGQRAGHTVRAIRLALGMALMLSAGSLSALAEAPQANGAPEVEINKKGLGKEAIVRNGAHEWYMLVEVTPDNTVIVRQHKQGETYLVDESETHDRPFLSQEVDDAIRDFVSSAKAEAAQRPQSNQPARRP